jgi:hypothetical protein
MVPVRAPKILAVCFVLLGIVFVIWGISWAQSDLYDAAGIPLIFTGVVFIVVAVAMMFLGRRLSGAKSSNDPLTRTGIPGHGTVLAIRETGISFRSGREVLVGIDLMVQLPGQAPYNVSIEQGVPRIVLGGVLPGSIVVVRVDPADPANVAIDFSAAPRPGTGPVATGGVPGTPMPPAPMPGAPAAGPMVGGAIGGAVTGAVVGAMGTMGAPGAPAAPGVPPPGGPGQVPPGVGGMPQSPVPGMPPVAAVKTAKELLATGRRGTARVLSAQDMGMTVAQTGKQPEDPSWLDDRIFLLVLEVHVDGQPPYTAQVGHRVPDGWLAQLQPGLQVPVAVDPVTPTSAVAIDWGGQ